jgi:hypothetical protein
MRGTPLGFFEHPLYTGLIVINKKIIIEGNKIKEIYIT